MTAMMMVMMFTTLQLVAVFCSGAFFGAALYISLVQHPAMMQCGHLTARQFFPPMYHRAAPMQITLALLGTAAGVSVWFLGAGIQWLIGALCLLSSIPITLILIKPINDALLKDTHGAIDADTLMSLLRRWAALHWLRTTTSGVAFILYLLAFGAY